MAAQPCMPTSICCCSHCHEPESCAPSPGDPWVTAARGGLSSFVVAGDTYKRTSSSGGEQMHSRASTRATLREAFTRGWRLLGWQVSSCMPCTQGSCGGQLHAGSHSLPSTQQRGRTARGWGEAPHCAQCPLAHLGMLALPPRPPGFPHGRPWLLLLLLALVLLRLLFPL